MRGNNAPTYRRLPHILFVDDSNSNRSQMAEGYLRQMAGEFIETQSAGMSNRALERLTVEVMQEDGIDIRSQKEKLVSRELLLWADIIITISGPEEGLQPSIPPSATEKRWPIALPQAGESEDATLSFRRTRDDVKRRVQQLVNTLKLFRSNAS